ncbi:alpha/beta fold hydrolase [Agreia sp. VKM Ac-1783]|uniref:alpha/beta fold hydrolase n=1 Tax=Agreia sp. VKM Ac-1783 TaxID=1938889 RepID=UPI000A2AB207|nr:alpha/beta fold hydrolase [Agreia sp. VKM Ac-1783]SMQ74928.1 Pimeloyl-ACP methyl ester carboxylesterase [Agreia sp. VKM Ac-1783]
MTPSLPQDTPIVESGNPDARTLLLLHGGGGPQTVAPIAGHLAATMHVLAPTHPGWNGTSRPDDIASVAQLATAYLENLLERGERDVVVVGSSIGGWIALEMAIQSADERYVGLVGAVIDIDGVGAVVEGEPVADFFALDARQLAEAAWHNPELGYRDPAAFTDEQRAIQQSNGQTMAAIAGRGMSDATLLERLDAITVPTLVVFGASDRIVTPAYGPAVARAIPGAEFAVVPDAGHLPHLEAPESTWAVIDPFVNRIR